MARTSIPVTTIQPNSFGVPTIVAADATNDMQVDDNDGNVFIVFDNAGVSAGSATIVGQQNENGRLRNITVSIPAAAASANGVAVAGPFPPDMWNLGKSGPILVDFTSATSLRAFAVRLVGF